MTGKGCYNCHFWSKVPYLDKNPRRICRGFDRSSTFVQLLPDDDAYGVYILTLSTFYCKLWQEDWSGDRANHL